MDPMQYLQMLTGGMDLSALGATLVNNPEAATAHLASKGIVPPTLPTEAIPQNAQPTQGPPLGDSPLGMITPRSQVGQPQPIGRPRPPMPPASGIPFEGPTQGMLDQGPMPPGAADNPLSVPIPQPRPQAGAGRGITYGGAGAPREGTPDAMSAQAQGQGQGDLLKSLRGVQAPKPPEAPRVSTPNAERPHAIQTGDIMAKLLAQISGQGGQVNPLLLGNVLDVMGRPRSLR